MVTVYEIDRLIVIVVVVVFMMVEDVVIGLYRFKKWCEIVTLRNKHLGELHRLDR